MKRQSIVLVAVASMAAVASTSVLAKDGPRRGGNIFKKADLDNDGKLSLEELVNQATSRFDKADANKDGEITAEELAEASRRQRSERRAQRMLTRLDYKGDGKVPEDFPRPSEAEMRAEESVRAADAEGGTPEGAVFEGRIRPAAGALRLRAAR